MALTKPELACENVIKTLKISRLTFSVQETPYSAYLTIRKKFASNPPSELSSLCDVETQSMDETCETFRKEISQLKAKLGELECEKNDSLESIDQLKDAMKMKEFENEALKSEKNAVVQERDKLEKQLDIFRTENKTLSDELETFEKNGKCFNKVLKQKDKQLYDLEKESMKLSEDLQNARSEFATLKSQVNKERKDAERSRKKTAKKEFLNNLKSDANQPDNACTNCDECFVSKVELQKHMSNHHIKCNSTQTESKVYTDQKVQVKESDFDTFDKTSHKFEKYSCIYCGFNIASESALQEHIARCSGSHKHSFLRGHLSPYPSQLTESKYPSQVLPFPQTFSSLPFKTTFSLPVEFPQQKSL